MRKFFVIFLSFGMLVHAGAPPVHCKDEGKSVTTRFITQTCRIGGECIRLPIRGACRLLQDTIQNPGGAILTFTFLYFTLTALAFPLTEEAEGEEPSFFPKTPDFKDLCPEYQCSSNFSQIEKLRSHFYGNVRDTPENREFLAHRRDTTCESLCFFIQNASNQEKIANLTREKGEIEQKLQDYYQIVRNALKMPKAPLAQIINATLYDIPRLNKLIEMMKPGDFFNCTPVFGRPSGAIVSCTGLDEGPRAAMLPT